MQNGKIRGLKRREHELDSWSNFHRELDLERLKDYGYVYAKAKFGPWANLYQDRPYPSGYRKKLFSNLIDFYSNWKEQLEKEFNGNYYLKIWISFPRFIDSQIVAAIGDKAAYYETLFESAITKKKFPLQMFNHETQRINEFEWSSHFDNDYHLESEFINIEPSEYYSMEDYLEEKKFYTNLLKKNTPFRMINVGNGEERLYQIKKGFTWIGEIK